jgi:integrase
MGLTHPKPASPLFCLGSSTTSLVDLVLAALPSPNTRRAYATAIANLSTFAAGRPLTRMLLLEWRQSMDPLSSSTVNVRLSAARKLLREAWRTGALDSDTAAALLDVAGLPRRGSRIGNWLTPDQTRSILAVPGRKFLRGKRNYCILALLTGCALRRFELAELELETLQRREGRWVLADLVGKGGRVRTVAVPAWVKQAVDDWCGSAHITSGKIIRRLTLDPAGLSDDAIWQIVQKAASRIGVKNFGPHDLRRTSAKLCRNRGGDIEQIQFMLGHQNLVTTQRYLGSTQNLHHAVNDDLGL